MMTYDLQTQIGRNAWLHARHELETQVAELVGRSISTVTYVGISYSGTPFEIGRDDGIHVVDQGVHFQFDDNTDLSVTWEWDFHQYHIGLRPGRFLTSLTDNPRWDTISEWNALLHVPIEEAMLWWTPSYVYGPRQTTGGKRILDNVFPEILQLRFQNNRSVWLWAMQYHGPDMDIFPGGDDIGVIFDRETARKVGFDSTLLHRDPLQFFDELQKV